MHLHRLRSLLVEVKQLIQKPALFAATVVTTSVVPVIIILALYWVVTRVGERLGAACDRAWSGLCSCSLNELVQFAAIQPDTTTAWAVIYFNPLSVCYDQGDFLTHRTLHKSRSYLCWLSHSF
jgi:hypothetical protein